MLNSNQRKVLIVGIIAIVVMGIFPPWTYTFKYESTYSEVPAGYSLILIPPAPRNTSYVHGVKLDISKLIIQWLIITASTGLGIFLLSNKKDKVS
jgi:hypothetical protein